MNGLSPQQILEIQAELQNGGKIAAVKLYKDWMGCSLLEAKNAVEAIQQAPPGLAGELPDHHRDSISLDQGMESVDQAIARGEWVDAVKRYRELTGKSLMECKTYIDERKKRLVSGGAVDSKQSGCFSAMLLVASLVGCLLGVVVVSATDSAVDPTPCGHAHNDYLHDRPLIDALDHGFCSIEADIYLVDGKLLVAHDLHKTHPERTLESLYLDPLRDHINRASRVKPSGGSVSDRITLLIDIKSEPTSTYQALDHVLEHYRDVLVHVDENGIHPGAVLAIISGNRDIESIKADPTRYAGIDGRLTDLDGKMSADLMPLISDHWGRHFGWRGEGELPISEREKLIRIVTEAHASGRRVRFWATPDLPAVWSALADAGVDLINTDDLPGLSRFLRERN